MIRDWRAFRAPFAREVCLSLVLPGQPEHRGQAQFPADRKSRQSPVPYLHTTTRKSISPATNQWSSQGPSMERLR